MSPYDSNNVIYINSDGFMKKSPSDSSYYLRPVISIDENINVKSGDGTYSNPYML